MSSRESITLEERRVHKVIEPKLLYFGTPVVLISTLNEDGSPNLAPMSSAWWLGQDCMLGMGTRSKTVENLRREMQCVLNLPSADMVPAVDRLALTTAKDPMPEYKVKMGFQHITDKFSRAGLTPAESDIVRAPRVLECPVQLEALVTRIRPFGEPEDYTAAIEVHIVRVHIEEDLLNTERRHHIDPDKWRPLIMSFCEFYGLGDMVHSSRLAKVY
jgi:flavin reductase (DIM6/NTAB) family NADH-FMN oxidoreductase RutF